MSKIFSFFSPAPKPRAPAPPPPSQVAQPKQKKASSKRAQLIALKATGAGGLQDEANIGRRKVLV